MPALGKPAINLKEPAKKSELFGGMSGRKKPKERRHESKPGGLN